MKLIAHRWSRLVFGALLLAMLFPLSANVTGAAAAADDWTNATSNLATQSACPVLLSAVPGSNTVIAGSWRHGLWATHDGGASWQPLGTGQGSASITNGPSWISFDPLNPARFYEAGIYYGGGAFATANGGTTFAQLGTLTHNDFVSIDYTDPDRKTLLVGGHEQPRMVWKSTDGGKSWTNVGLNLPSGTGFSSDPLIIDARTYLVNAVDTPGTGATPGIFRTTDGGATWTRVSSLGPGGVPLVSSDGSIYWPVADALAKSSDHGVTWSLVGGGFVNQVHPIDVPGGRLVTAHQSGELVMSSDGGATWESVGPPLPYVPTGVVYSDNQKALFIWHSDCGGAVPADAIQKLSYDFSSAAGPIAHPATVQLLANWVSPTYVTAGQSVTVHQDVYTDQDVNLTLTVDIFNNQGERVLHSSLDNQALGFQQLTPVSVKVPVPTSMQSGKYVVKTAALGPDGTQYAESDSAGQFVAVATPPMPSDDNGDSPDQPQSAPSDAQ